MKEIAILMAAGLGSRMRPLTETTAKPLVRVRGVPLVETVLAALLRRGVGEIYIVVGYRKEQFLSLADRYHEVHLVENPYYLERNNISSIAAVADVMAASNCFVCEADLFIPNDNVLCRQISASGYLGKFVPGFSDDWVFDIEDEISRRITRIGKGGADCFNMVGISYFRQPEAAVVARAVATSANEVANYSLFWDDIVNRLVHQGLTLTVHEVKQGEIFECDTISDLERLENGYENQAEYLA